MPTPPTYTGTIEKLVSDPRTLTLRLIPASDPPTVSFNPLTADQWTLLCGTADGKQVTVTAPGPGTTPTSVSRP